jgi:hypothetical protein
VFRKRGPRFGLVGIVYLVVGVIVADSHHYLENIHGLRGVVSAILAVALWPLLLLGINLHIRR